MSNQINQNRRRVLSSAGFLAMAGALGMSGLERAAAASPAMHYRQLLPARGYAFTDFAPNTISSRR